jgi:integrase
MLTIYKRHIKDCGNRSRTAKRCACPVWVQGTLKGKPVRESLKLSNWEAAQKIVRSWEIDGRSAPVSLKDAGDRFVADLKARELSSETIAKNERTVNELVEYLGENTSLPSVTLNDLGKFREAWKLRPITARKKLERIRSFFKFCIERDWIEKNPAKGLLPPKEIDIERKPYEPGELEKIEWAIPLFPAKGIYGEANSSRLKVFITVLRWTGLRIRDVVQLKKSQVQGEYIILRTQKNKKPVKLLLHAEAKEALDGVDNPGEYFFWSGLGNAKSCVGDWQRTLARLSKIAGFRIHAHRWRHNFAADLLSKGVPVSEVAAILGNSPRIVERHYSQWIDARQSSLDKAVKSAWA